MNELKTNILIDNDILNSELFDISMFNSTAYIESCEIIVSIIITINRIIQIKFIHFTKISLISSYFERLIFMYRIFVLDRDYLFESIDLTNFFIYAHMINI